MRLNGLTRKDKKSNRINTSNYFLLPKISSIPLSFFRNPELDKINIISYFPFSRQYLQ